MYCKLFKLTNGETILGTVDSDKVNLDSGAVNVQNPVLITSARVPMDQLIIETYVMQSWIKMASSKVISIPVRSILIATDVHEKAVEQYKHYLTEIDKNQLSDEEIENAINLHNENNDTDEFLDLMEDEEDDDRSKINGPYIH